MTNRYLDGERPAPRPAADVAARRRLGDDAARPTGERSRRACSTRRWPSCGRSSAAPTRSSTPSSRGSWPRPAKAGDEAAGERLRGVLGDLVEACRLRRRSPPRRSCPATAPRVLAQLGYAYPYGPTATADRRSSTSSLGRPRGRAGPLAAPEPLFPRLDVEAGSLIVRGPVGRPAPRGCPMRLIDSHCHLNADRFEADADQVVGGGPAGRRRADPRPRLERRLVASARSRCVDRFAVARRRGRRPSARRRQGRRRGLGRDRRPGRRPAGRRDRRDRARLRPGLQPDRGPARPTCGGTSALALETGQAGDPPLPLGGRAGATPRTRCVDGAARGRASAGPPGRPRSASGRRRSSTRSPGPLDYARDGHRPRPRGQLLRARLPARRGGVGRGRRARARATGCSSRPIRRSSRHPARRARATNPSGCASQGRGLAEQRDDDHRRARARPRRRLRPDLPESSEDAMTQRRPAACASSLVAVVLAVAAVARGRRRAGDSPSPSPSAAPRPSAAAVGSDRRVGASPGVTEPPPVARRRRRRRRPRAPRPAGRRGTLPSDRLHRRAGHARRDRATA